jgi:septum formation protein
MPDLYLASKSPRRRELLEQIGVRFAVVDAEVVEEPCHQESAIAYVERLAREKALAGFLAVQSMGLVPRPVLGSDTLVVCDDLILEKPRDAIHAAAMLRLLSGRSHQVLTAVALVDGTREQLRTSATEVAFRPLDDAEIAAYWATGEPADKAGGYAIQGLGAVFVEQIRGSYSGVVGLPIETIFPLLQAFGVPCWQQQEDAQ